MSVERKEESASTVSREIRQSFDARTEGRVPTRKKRGGTRSDRSISSSTEQNLLVICNRQENIIDDD